VIAAITNTKGGVGKSTFSQILCAYFYEKTNKKSSLIEIDDENNDSITFSRSETMNSKIILTQNIKSIDELFYDQNNDVVIDVGGNKTAKIFLNEVKKIDFYENIIWFIPLGCGEQDNQNALETYLEIKKLDKDAKIIFVLSNVRTNDLEWEFLNFFGNKYLETNLAICNQIDDVKYLTVKSDSILSNARYFNKTVYELALSKTNFKALAQNTNDIEQRRKYILFNRVQNEAKEYAEYLRTDLFVQLDEIIEGLKK
jgi:spore coat polysaccharide biosynthesis predicted glycosyltransferase SpsG